LASVRLMNKNIGDHVWPYGEIGAILTLKGGTFFMFKGNNGVVATLPVEALEEGGQLHGRASYVRPTTARKRRGRPPANPQNI